MKNIIITGTSRGIGYELALQFANAGHNVLAISRKTPQDLIENQNITCLSVDLSDENEMQKVENFLSHSWKKVDIIIHNAGSLLLKAFSETSQEDFENKYCMYNTGGTSMSFCFLKERTSPILTAI